MQIQRIIFLSKLMREYWVRCVHTYATLTMQFLRLSFIQFIILNLVFTLKKLNYNSLQRIVFLLYISFPIKGNTHSCINPSGHPGMVVIGILVRGREKLTEVLQELMFSSETEKKTHPTIIDYKNTSSHKTFNFFLE